MVRTRPLSPLLWLLAVLVGVLALAAHPASASAAGGAGTRVGASEQIFATRTGVSAAESVHTQRGNITLYGGLVVGDLLATEATAAGSSSGTTTMFRAVEPGELSDISASGAYRVPNGIGDGKYFYPTSEQAANFARMNPGRSYTLTSGEFPTEVVNSSWNDVIAGEGRGYFIEGQHFPYGPVNVGGPLP